MTYEELEKVIENYRHLADQSQMLSEQKAFRYQNFANYIETNIDLLEDATNEDEIWDFYNEHSQEGFDMLNPDEEDY